MAKASASATGNTTAAEPRIICCSATIANSDDHFYRLFPKHSLSRDLAVIGPEMDGSPHGRRLISLWNPAELVDFNAPAPRRQAQVMTDLEFLLEEEDPLAVPMSISPEQLDGGPSPTTEGARRSPDTGPAVSTVAKFGPSGRQLPIHLAHSAVGVRSFAFFTVWHFNTLLLACPRYQCAASPQFLKLPKSLQP